VWAIGNLREKLGVRKQGEKLEQLGMRK